MRLFGAFFFGLCISLSSLALAQSAAPASSDAPVPAAAAPSGAVAQPDAAVVAVRPKAVLDDALTTTLTVDPKEEYAEPTWTNLIRAMIRGHAIDLSVDDTLLDEYAQISECEIFVTYHQDDFEWEKVRKVVRKSVEQTKGTFPARFSRQTKIQLDHYDFKNKLYHFTTKSLINLVNTFVLLDDPGQICVKDSIVGLPHTFKAVTVDPLTILGLSLSQADAEGLLRYMESVGNNDHILYTNIDMTLKYMLPLRRELKNVTTRETTYTQAGTRRGEFRMEFVVDRVRFYADEDRKTLVYTLKP